MSAKRWKPLYNWTVLGVDEDNEIWGAYVKAETATEARAKVMRARRRWSDFDNAYYVIAGHVDIKWKDPGSAEFEKIGRWK